MRRSTETRPRAARARVSLGALGVLVIALASPSHGETPAFVTARALMQAPPGDSTLILEGARWWSRSPDRENPVACATCHHDVALTRAWAASFPKVKPMPPPDARVMTLLQANAEAATRHYRVKDPRPAATAITAYLTALGGDVPISPGIAVGQPVFPQRIRQLGQSVERGEALFTHRCARCHQEGYVAPLIGGFPRLRAGRAESLEGFLELHLSIRPSLSWHGQEMADVIAYLTSKLAGRPARSPAEHIGREQP